MDRTTTSMAYLLRSVRLPALACGLLLACAGSASASTYPRLGLYGNMLGNGYPYILGGDRSGPIDPGVCDSVARYDEVVLDASPISEYRPDVAGALRQRHPGITLLALVVGHGIWQAQDPDSLVHFPTRYYRLVRELDAFLYDRDGNLYSYGGANVNLARRDAQGRFVVAEGLADLFYDAVVRSGVWDGIFVDVFCDRFAWTQAAGDSIDYQRAGYSTLQAFDDAWKAASDTLANRLRRRAGPDFVLVGNCGQGTKYAAFNGWMRENFPYQNGGTWTSNMFRDPGGYFTDEARFRMPRHNFIFTGAEPPWDPYSTNNARKVRYGLGSASLGDGFGVFGYSSRAVAEYDYTTWWYDEYAVDLVTGRASASLAHTGWLGQPLGAATQTIWISGAPDVVTNPDFESDVTSGWNFVALVPATLAPDTASAGSGMASARVSMSTTANYPWRVHYSTTGRLSMTAGRSHSATFWARASAPRPLTVVAAIPGGAVLAEHTVSLTAQWQRFQVVLTPQSSGSAALYFWLAGEPGEAWLDDVHFQAGASSVWRRDFQNGTVLVNPTELPLTVPLGRPYRRIAGPVAPAVNDGVEDSQATVGAEDALFLIGDDFIPPTPVSDLRPVPR